MLSSPSAIPRHTLDEDTSRRLWNWTLRRQGLSDRTRLDSVEAIAYAALGLHAARLPSPFATVAARSTEDRVTHTLFDQAVRERIMTVRCMRKTLHTLPLDLAAAAHAATRHFRERDALRATANAGEELTAVRATADDLASLLDADGPLHHREIERRLSHRGIPVSRVRLALKLAWEQGTLAYANTSPTWNRETRTFALTKQAYPEVNFGLDRQTATTALTEAYFDRYGPASLRDAAWWSGLSRSAITAALAAGTREVMTIGVAWSSEPQVMFADRWNQFTASDPDDHSTGVNFLAHEDVALKAYFESRRRYLDDVPARRAFNRIGEVLPVILHDGHVIGTWTWEDAQGRVKTHLIGRKSTTDLRRTIRRRAELMSTTLRSRWAGAASAVAAPPAPARSRLTAKH